MDPNHVMFFQVRCVWTPTQLRPATSRSSGRLGQQVTLAPAVVPLALVLRRFRKRDGTLQPTGPVSCTKSRCCCCCCCCYCCGCFLRCFCEKPVVCKPNWIMVSERHLDVIGTLVEHLEELCSWTQTATRDVEGAAGCGVTRSGGEGGHQGTTPAGKPIENLWKTLKNMREQHEKIYENGMFLTCPALFEHFRMFVDGCGTSDAGRVRRDSRSWTRQRQELQAGDGRGTRWSFKLSFKRTI